MRRVTAVAALLGMMASLSACIDLGEAVDPRDPVQRAAAGAAIGATLGAGLGATVAINPLIGATIGVAGGAAAGAVTGVVTTAPSPSYGPIAPRDTAYDPGFYDSWPPGYSALPAGSAAAPVAPNPG